MPEKLLTADDAAAVFGCNPETIHRWRRTGLVTPSLVVGRMPLFTCGDLHGLIDTFESKHRTEIEALRARLAEHEN